MAALSVLAAPVAAAPAQLSPAAEVGVPVPAADDSALRPWVQRLQTVGSETSSVATQLIDTALGLVGVPYRMGGSSPQAGFDCSGFVRYVYANTLGLMLPRRAVEQAQAAQPVARDQLQPGDLVFFNTMRRAFSHVGVYLGDGKFVHAPSKGDRVKVSSLDDRYWARRYNGARRVALPDDGAAPWRVQGVGVPGR
ncbi:Murein DD-endopeptidase MepH [Tepidimonas aquatica]|uniref:Murein DD-endopeptidase MepH n=1 Tax=Tepidimonas aquatica TaxID=247482 RepID=A0A554WQH3_9BURK|nr:Murein DD-endopeptidase MepH [Tepidimonas aquatica]